MDLLHIDCKCDTRMERSIPFTMLLTVGQPSGGFLSASLLSAPSLACPHRTGKPMLTHREQGIWVLCGKPIWIFLETLEFSNSVLCGAFKWWLLFQLNAAERMPDLLEPPKFFLKNGVQLVPMENFLKTRISFQTQESLLALMCCGWSSTTNMVRYCFKG